MGDNYKTKRQLIKELEELRQQNAQLKMLEIERTRSDMVLQERAETPNSLYENELIAMYITSIETGRPLDANNKGINFAGYSSREKFLAEFVSVNYHTHPEKRKELINELRLKGEIYKKEHEFVKKDGTSLWVELYAKIHPENGWIESALIDISERKQLENALKKSQEELEKKVDERTAALKFTNEQLQQEIISRKQAEEKLRDSEDRARSLLNAPVDIALLVDNKYNILDCNESLIKRFNKSKDELVGSCVLDLFTPEVAKSRKEHTDKLFQTGKSVFFEDQRRGRWFDNFAHPIFDSQGNVTKIAIFVRDTTERKQIEEKLIEYQKRLRALTSQMTLTEEKERKLFAEYLHDKIGQQLFVLKIKLDDLTKRVSSNDTYEALDNILKITDHLIKNARSLTFELSPPILYQLGLEAALEWLTEQTEKQYSIMVTFEDDKQEKLMDDDVKILLFQAVRELLTNIAKHAQAQKVKVSIQRDNTHTRICVEDDGVGFTPSETILSKSKLTGFGLFSIEERLDYFGGCLKITSQAGFGTQATLIAPLKGKDKVK